MVEVPHVTLRRLFHVPRLNSTFLISMWEGPQGRDRRACAARNPKGADQRLSLLKCPASTSRPSL